MARNLQDNDREPFNLNPETLTMMTKTARAHFRNALQARRAGNRRLARQFIRFARAAIARG